MRNWTDAERQAVECHALLAVAVKLIRAAARHTRVVALRGEITDLADAATKFVDEAQAAHHDPEWLRVQVLAKVRKDPVSRRRLK